LIAGVAAATLADAGGAGVGGGGEGAAAVEDGGGAEPRRLGSSARRVDRVPAERANGG
jgi:hypothetical protein